MNNLLTYIFGKTRSTLRSIVKTDRNTIYDRPDFHKLVELERDRVHRNDMQFSLILFNVDRNDDNHSPLNALTQTISKRVRRIDQVGWYDNFHLAILLPDTSPLGAQTIAKDICRDRVNTPFTIRFETISYPEKK